VRATAWDTIGGLDERFYPVYYVDADLSMAIRQLGLVVLYQPGSRIRHHLGASTTRHFRTFLSERNRRLFLKKWSAALEEHEPCVEGSPEAMERALARAASFKPRQKAAIGPPPQRPAFDPGLHEIRHLKKSRALKRAYAAYCAASLVRFLITKAGMGPQSGFYSIGRRMIHRVVDRIAIDG
jgi:GT2 family glycosyltransferase